MTNRIDEAKAAVVEALKLNPKLTVKYMTERSSKTPAVAEGFARRGCGRNERARSASENHRSALDRRAKHGYAMLLQATPISYGDECDRVDPA